jgi:uncharacterized glyoxalase superfamily protein PhnB
MYNRSVPTSTILAHLIYNDVAAACDWLTRFFGFSEYYRYGQPLGGIQMYLGDAHIMLTGPREGRSDSPAKLGYGTQMLTILVPDVDAHYANTKPSTEKNNTALQTSKVIVGCFRSTPAM